MRLRVHGLIFGSHANGPGRRHVVHTQGCSLNCPGCFNSNTHPDSGATLWDTAELASHLLATPCEGVTISGGEPFQQPEALTGLLKALRYDAPTLSILAFSGYTLEELKAREGCEEALSLLDVLVDGRYEHGKLAEGGLRGSANQRVHLLSKRHSPNEVTDRCTEILIRPDGTIMLTGFPEGKLLGALRREG